MNMEKHKIQATQSASLPINNFPYCAIQNLCKYFSVDAFRNSSSY